MTNPTTHLEAIARFISGHGFSPVVDHVAHVVRFSVPYSLAGRFAGEERFAVSTVAEARAALGY